MSNVSRRFTQINADQIRPAVLGFQNQLDNFANGAVASGKLRHVVRVFASFEAASATATPSPERSISGMSLRSSRWGLLLPLLDNSGIVVPVIDGLLAATALEHNLKLVTRDTDRFHRWVYKGAQYYNQL